MDIQRTGPCLAMGITMTELVSQGACPYCTSSDAYAEYADGGHHCYSCGAHKPGSAYAKLLGGATVHPKETKLGRCPPLPEDAMRLLGRCVDGVSNVVGWLQRYGITYAEMDRHDFLFSPEKQYLIFPVYNIFGSLLMWQARYFGSNPKHPKYITRGVKDVLHIVGKPDRSFLTPDHYVETKPRLEDGTIVLVEDLLSAIKVGRVCSAMPLWGSHLSVNTAHRLSLQFKKAVLWLDYDKRQEAVKIALERSMVLPVHVVITQHDPKTYTEEEIREKIN